MNGGAERALRGERVTVRLTVEERRVLEARARECGRTVSAYLRETALGAVPRRSAGVAGRKTRYQLARIGNNLNQLAHRANATRQVEAVEALLATLAKLDPLLDQLAQ